MQRLLLLITCILTLSACEKIAVLATPPKKPHLSRSQLATQAEKQFWQTLHQGNYAKLPETTQLLTAAYLENPNDSALTAHLGFAHIWKITERAREKNVPPTVTDEIILAKQYFKYASELKPQDARTQGFKTVVKTN